MASGIDGARRADEMAEEFLALYNKWTNTLEWEDTLSYEKGNEVYESIHTTRKLAQKFASDAKEKHSESSSKKKARELREKADELLARAKELEDEL